MGIEEIAGKVSYRFCWVVVRFYRCFSSGFMRSTMFAFSLGGVGMPYFRVLTGCPFSMILRSRGSGKQVAKELGQSRQSVILGPNVLQQKNGESTLQSQDHPKP